MERVLDVAHQLGIRFKRMSVEGRSMRVFVSGINGPKSKYLYPINELLERCVSKTDQRFLDVEPISIGVGPDAVCLFSMRRKMPLAWKVSESGGKMLRVPIFEPRDGDDAWKGFVIQDYAEKGDDTMKFQVQLLDGTFTDNTGWKRLERGSDVYWMKEVNGKKHMIDNWKAIAARIEGAVTSKMPESAFTPPKQIPNKTLKPLLPKKEKIWDRLARGEYTPTSASVPRRSTHAPLRAVPSLPSKKPTTSPKRRAGFSMGDVLSERAKDLTKKGKK